jgi:class 3 adenylate cyclase/tetratricopeptide (TPR) repeat protein
MRCPRCETENRDDRRFCARCGAALPAKCPHCGFLNDVEDRFCGGCGASFVVSGAAPQAGSPIAPELPRSREVGERRQVTILFADLTGFTRLTSELGAEEAHAILNRYLAVLDEIVGGYDGTVEYIGDAVMALFGAPVAHGDDPLRAVHAAGDIHKGLVDLTAEFGRSLQVHIGIASGAVVAAGLGRDGKAKYTAIGESVNLAARLCALASPGETILSEAVRRAVGQRVASAAAGDVTLKGFDRPVPVWRVTGYGESGAPLQFDTPLIGRNADLKQFAGLVEACHETRAGRVLLIRGEAGIGKTRLAAEFMTIAVRTGFACHKGLVLDFGAGKGQGAVPALMHSLLGIAVGAGKEIRAAAADAAVADCMLSDDQRVFINDLLDLPQPMPLRALYDAMDASTRQRGKEIVLETMLRDRAARSPLLLLVEDIHWADPPTLTFIAAMARVVAACPAILLMTTRIDGDPIDAAWRSRIDATPLTTIDLGPLRVEDARALARALSAQEDSLAQRCVERAEGNPLFLEQLLRNIDERTSDAVPASIQSLVLARIDRLAPAHKAAAQAASVIGQRFSLPALRAVLDDQGYDCAGLIAHRLVRPEDDDYLFAHALVRDGVYGSLLGPARRELHRRAAAWFGTSDPILRAQHLDLASDEMAPSAYLEAARSQEAAYNNDRALQLIERGLALAKAPVDRFALTNLKGEILHDIGAIPQSVAAHQAALVLAPDDAARCAAWFGVAAGLRVLDRYDEALALLDQSEALAAARSLAGELARIHHLRGNLYFPLGRVALCLGEHQQALRHAREAGLVEAEVRALGGLGDAEYARGRMLTASECFRKCVELAEANGLGRIAVANMPMRAFTLEFILDLEGSIATARHALEIARKVGARRAEMITHHGLFSFIQYNLVAAREAAERSIALAQELGAPRFEAEGVAFIALIEQAEGRTADALVRAERALAIGRETGMSYMGPFALAILASTTPDATRRDAALAEGESILEAGSLSHNYYWFYREGIDLCLRLGDWARAERCAAALEDYFSREPTPLTDFVVARGRALAAHGRGRRDAGTQGELRRLKDLASANGLKFPLIAINRALAEHPGQAAAS